jgi:replicative DNA helicase
MAGDEVAHGRVVLSAVIGGTGSLSALDYAWERLTPEHFTDRAQRKLFEVLRRYADLAGGIMSASALADMLRDQKAGSAQMYGEAYAAIAGLPLPELHAFRHSVAQLRELAGIRLTEEGLAQGQEILRHGVTDSRGNELRGAADARAHVVEVFAEAEQAAGLSDSPGGDVVSEGDRALADYARIKELRAQGKVPGIEFGIASLDSQLEGGLGNGEMALIAAGTTAGKSSLCVQTAWYNSVMQGKNVLVFTTEQLRTALRIKFIARHSRHPKFGLPRGLDTAAIRSGRLTADEERSLTAVTQDLKTGGYGVCNIVQMPSTCTLDVMAGRAASISRTLPGGHPDLCIVDYLQLFQAVRPSRDARQNELQGAILKAAQRWAQSFRDGQGVPLISPWQVNKEGVLKMKSGSGFTLEDLSETSEASKTPGMVLGLASTEDDLSRGRRAQLELSVLKFRDGPRGWKFPIEADYATCYFKDREDLAELGETLGV